MTKTRERPILMSDPMVRAILDGRKTQTRRLVKPQPERWIDKFRPSLDPQYWLPSGVYISDPSGFLSKGRPLEVRQNAAPVKCPYVPGDTLWVRERFQWILADEDVEAESTKKPDGWNINYVATGGRLQYETPDGELSDATSPSIHMPRWAARILLTVTDVRAQRLQEISKEDVRAEGCEPDERQDQYTDGSWARSYSIIPARTVFSELWDSLNAKRGYPWESNPWVWAVTFERKQP